MPAEATGDHWHKKRDKDLVEHFWDKFIAAQQLGELALSNTDAKLVCGDGGFIRVHSAYLYALSPFFRKCFLSQGAYFNKMHDIFLPDFTTPELLRLIQFLYYGTVTCANELEVVELDKNLDVFQISPKPKLAQTPPLPSSAGENKIRFKEPSKKKAMNTVPMPPDITGAKGTKRSYNDSDYEPDTDDESGADRRPAKTSKTSASDINWKDPNYKDKSWFSREANRCQVCNKKYNGPAKVSECVTSHGKLRCYFCFLVRKDTEALFEHFRIHHKKSPGKEGFLLCPYCDQSIPFKSVSCHVISNHLTDAMIPSTPEKEKGVKDKAGDKGQGQGKGSTPKTTPNSAKATTSKSSTPAMRPGIPVVVLERNGLQVKSNKKATNENESQSQLEMGIEKKDHWYQIREDGMISVGDLDVTFRTKMPNGDVLVRRIQKKYSLV